MSAPDLDAESLLGQALRGGRLHSAYLISGPVEAARSAALAFARGVVCCGPEPPCEACDACRRSAPGDPLPLDGTGKKGPLLRHVGDHPDLLWVERGADDTRVRIGQVRALQRALQLRSAGAGRRVAVIADAEWLNQEAQNALLRVLEEPPAETSLVLVAAQASGLLATVRSRCQRVTLPVPRTRLDREALGDEAREWVERFDALGAPKTGELLDWAEAFRGARAPAAAAVSELLETATLWLRERAGQESDPAALRPTLRAFAEVQSARKALAQRNANPQMVAERALFALQDAVRGR